jgi:hypothetical protein
MLRKRAAHQKKVDSAVRVLQTTTGVNVPMAIMILAGFSKSDIADKIVRQQVRRRLALMGVTDNNQREVILSMMTMRHRCPTLPATTMHRCLRRWNRHPRPPRQTPSQKKSRSGQLHLLSNNIALTT